MFRLGDKYSFRPDIPIGMEEFLGRLVAECSLVGCAGRTPAVPSFDALDTSAME